MKKLLIAIMLFASASAVSAQTKPAQQKKLTVKKECVKKCEKEAAGSSCCESATKSKAAALSKKATAKKG